MGVSDLKRQLKCQEQLLQDQTSLTNVYRMMSQKATNAVEFRIEARRLSLSLFNHKKEFQEIKD